MATEVAPPHDVPSGPLTAADIEAFERDGFVVLRGFFSPEDVATARAGLDALTDERKAAVSPLNR